MRSHNTVNVQNRLTHNENLLFLSLLLLLLPRVDFFFLRCGPDCHLCIYVCVSVYVHITEDSNKKKKKQCEKTQQKVGNK